MNWTKINLLQLPKDGTEFLVRNGNQGGVMNLVYWDVIHNYWKSKGEPISLQGTEWMNIPKFIPMCTYDCAKCGKDFQDELYPEGPQNLSDNYDFLCPECKKTIPLNLMEFKKEDIKKMLYECVLYKDNVPGDRYSRIVNESDVAETETGLRIDIGNTSHYISHLEYDYYEIYEID